MDVDFSSVTYMRTQKDGFSGSYRRQLLLTFSGSGYLGWIYFQLSSRLPWRALRFRRSHLNKGLSNLIGNIYLELFVLDRIVMKVKRRQPRLEDLLTKLPFFSTRCAEVRSEFANVATGQFHTPWCHRCSFGPVTEGMMQLSSYV